MIAATAGHDAVVSVLTDTDGVELNAVDATGATPLLLATRADQYECAMILCTCVSVDVNVPDEV